MSASTPAPPDGSKPAIEITVNISRSNGRNRTVEAPGPRRPVSHTATVRSTRDTLCGRFAQDHNIILGVSQIYYRSRGYSASPSMSTDLTTPSFAINEIHEGEIFNRLLSSLLVGAWRSFQRLGDVHLKWFC